MHSKIQQKQQTLEPHKNRYDAVSFALTFQNEMMEQDWHKDLLQDDDAKVEFVKISNEEKENYERARKNGAVKKSTDGSGVSWCYERYQLSIRSSIYQSSMAIYISTGCAVFEPVQSIRIDRVPLKMAFMRTDSSTLQSNSHVCHYFSLSLSSGIN